ncbi:hypothetical protein [Azonexus sp. R2A61]|uniref:hypothetical protein n=1 Tax=Azonexus sp. R2A61 TaxID=2744443 RepID=UPI001F1E703D|nr:hypothetical protein [Azonexus sp. R2A61]
MNIATLRKKAQGGLLEVEDLLQAAIEKQPGLSGELVRLATVYGWQTQGLQSNGTRVVPLAKWAAVASAYADSGFDGLRAQVQEPQDIPFVLGLAEEIKSSDAVAFVLEISAQYLRGEASEELAVRIASAFNLLLSFKQAAPVSAAQTAAIQNFLIGVYPDLRAEAKRATCLLALRGVGDRSAIQFVEAAADFKEPWSDTKSVVLRAIRKRLKAHAL